MLSRLLLAGLILMVLLPFAASADKSRRAPLPGGGSITFPAKYAPVHEGDFRWRSTGGVIAYRNHRSMASGTRECDGMIAVARVDAHEDLDEFVNAARGALTTRWAFGDETEGRWYGKENTRLPVERRTGPAGPELSGPLSIHIVGFFDVYDKPGRFFAVEHQGGLRVAVWLFDSHGGEKQARRIADAVVKSFSGSAAPARGR
ncbi:MAG: hypothetical protein ACK4MQ_10250 [Hyphomonas sp.]